MIAYTMLYAAAVGLPILLATLLGSKVLCEQGKAERGVWLGALALALALPFVAVVGPRAAAVTDPAPTVETGLIGLPAVVTVPAVPTVSVPVARTARLDLDQLLIGLWLLASLTLSVRWAVAARRLGKLTGTCPSATVDGVPVTLTSRLGPAVAGVLRPRILAPRWLMSMPPRQRYLVLAHEQEHVRARDPWLIVASRVARILAPWNPFVWLLSARLLRAIELDCDRRVLRQHPDIEAYGLTLLTVSSRDPSGLLGAAAFAESEAPLRRRILAMTTPPGTVSVVGILVALLLGALLIVGAFEVPIPTFRTDAQPAASAVWDPASSGTVAGLVRDATSGRPLEHIQIWVPCTGLGTLSNDEGRFLLAGVPAGEHRVVAERIGYGEIAQTVTVSKGATVTLELGLPETAIAVPGTVVSEEGDVQVGRTRAPDLVDSFRGSFEESACVVYESDLPARPVFTPFSVAPRVVNEDEVQRAMVEAHPPELREQGIGGTVQLYLFIDEEGEVQDYRLDQSSGHRALDATALAVAGVYRFSPALNRDHAHPVWVTFPITFGGGRAMNEPSADAPQLRVLSEELANARAELRALRERYSDEYPPVQELRERIRAMEEALRGGARDRREPA